ncbi:DUF7638 domain-containing protein [Mameliella alba]|uniref:DUF7638 domain-containing protein n=1 Tax=Mameliella alba TaxID=561184 RepID=UPI0014307585|nr:hypothetical protein [Mameliella alba]
MKASELTRRQATRTIDGLSFPVIQRIGDYHLVDMTVFEDGLIEAPELMDLAMFEEDVHKGRVRTSIPDGEPLRLGRSGLLDLEQGDWTLTPDALVERVYGLLAELNPGLDNLTDLQGSASHVVYGRLRWKQNRTRSAPWCEAEPDSDHDRNPGKWLWAFERGGESIDLVQLVLFRNDALTVTGSGGTRSVSLDDFEVELGHGRYDFPREGDRVTIRGLGAATCAYAAPGPCSGEALIGELRESGRELRGEPTSFHVCRSAADAYWAEPTEENLETLRRTYEAVPPHLRRYCGDMDEKDIPIRKVLYGDSRV